MAHPSTNTVPSPAVTVTRAAVYLRVSTEEQATDGYGLSIQRTQCRAMAIVKGWTINEARHIFADEGISGAKDATERPRLAALLEAVDASEVDAVIVLALDRLGRTSKIVLDLVDRLTGAGCELVSCQESLDTSTPAGLFVVQLFAALAQLDHSTIVRRLTDGRNARYYRDGERGGPLPYGYRRTTAGIIIDHVAARVIIEIFTLRAAGQSLRSVAAHMNAHAPSPRGRQWHASTIKVILDNEQTYTGHRGPGGAAWPVLLSGG